MPEIIVERRISDRAFVGHYVLAVVVGLLIAVGLFMTPAALFAPVGLLPVAGVFAYSRLTRLGTAYRLYPDRLEVESGLITRRIENLELFRIRDVGLRQGLMGRAANFGDVYVHSTDSSTPDLHLRAIDAPKEFYQELRDHVSNSRARNRTLIVEEGQAFPEG